MSYLLRKAKDIKLVIFDLDGTLIDAYPAIIKSFNYTLKELGYPLRGIRTIRRAVGWGDENLLRPFVREKDLSLALLIYRRHHKTSLLKGSRLFPQVKKYWLTLKIKDILWQWLATVLQNFPGSLSTTWR